MSFLRPHNKETILGPSGITDWALIGIFVLGIKKIFQSNREEKENRERAEQQNNAYQKLTFNEKLRLNPALINLRLDKQLGYEPKDGWERYKELAPQLADVKIQENAKHKTKNWPKWMLIEPKNPNNAHGRPWEPSDER